MLEAVRDHGIASGCLIGTYERRDGSIKQAQEEPVAIIAPSVAA